MGKKPLPLKDPDSFTLDELIALAVAPMQKILNSMSAEHKEILIKECENRIFVAQMVATTTPYVECADETGVTRFPAAYTLLKKYSHIYSCLTGWQTKEDLELRAIESGARKKLEMQVEELRQKVAPTGIPIPLEMMSYDQLKQELHTLQENL